MMVATPSDRRTQQTSVPGHTSSASYHLLVDPKCSSPSSARKTTSSSPSVSACSYTSAASSLRVAKSNMIDPRYLPRPRFKPHRGPVGVRNLTCAREKRLETTMACEVFHTSAFISRARNESRFQHEG